MEIITTMIETFMAYYLLHFVMEPEKSKKSRKYMGAVILFVFIILLNKIELDSTVKGLSIMCGQVLYAFLCFSGRKTEKILWGCSFTLIAILAELLTFRVSEVLKIGHLSAFLFPGDRDQVLLLYCLIFIILTVVTVRVHLGSLQLSGLHIAMVIVIIGSGIAALDWMLELMVLTGDLEASAILKQKIGEICLAILMMLSLMLCLIINLGRINRRYQLLQEQRLVEQYKQKEYHMILSSVHKLREWKHDIKGQMGVVQGLLSQAKLAEAATYMERLYGEIQSGIIVNDCGNEIVNVILTEKKEQAERNDIAFAYHVVWTDQMPLSDLNLAVLLENLLDNALEACLYVEQTNICKIEVEILPVNGNVRIVVTNNFDGTVIDENGEIKSRKQESGHGIGLKRVEEIVKAHGGVCQKFYDSEIFKVQIALPLERKGKI